MRYLLVLLLAEAPPAALVCAPAQEVVGGRASRATGGRREVRRDPAAVVVDLGPLLLVQKGAVLREAGGRLEVHNLLRVRLSRLELLLELLALVLP